MSDMSDLEVRVDVGVLKEQVSTLTKLCTKMDTLIDKLIDQQDNQLEKLYNEMEERRRETNRDISEVHQRIDTVIEKLQETELRIMTEMKNISAEIAQYKHMYGNNTTSPKIPSTNAAKKELMKLVWEFKYQILCAVFLISYIASHMDNVGFKAILNFLGIR
jgi:hypothetical protein